MQALTQQKQRTAAAEMATAAAEMAIVQALAESAQHKQRTAAAEMAIAQASAESAQLMQRTAAAEMTTAQALADSATLAADTAKLTADNTRLAAQLAEGQALHPQLQRARADLCLTEADASTARAGTPVSVSVKPGSAPCKQPHAQSPERATVMVSSAWPLMHLLTLMLPGQLQVCHQGTEVLQGMFKGAGTTMPGWAPCKQLPSGSLGIPCMQREAHTLHVLWYPWL